MVARDRRMFIFCFSPTASETSYIYVYCIKLIFLLLSIRINFDFSSQSALRYVNKKLRFRTKCLSNDKNILLGLEKPATTGYDYSAMGRPTLDELRKLALEAIIRPAIEKKKTVSSAKPLLQPWESSGGATRLPTKYSGLAKDSFPPTNESRAPTDPPSPTNQSGGVKDPTTNESGVVANNALSATNQSEGRRDPFLLSALNTRDIVYQDILEEAEETTRVTEDKLEEERVQAVYAETTMLPESEDFLETSR